MLPLTQGAMTWVVLGVWKLLGLQGLQEVGKFLTWVTRRMLLWCFLFLTPQPLPPCSSFPSSKHPLESPHPSPIFPNTELLPRPHLFLTMDTHLQVLFLFPSHCFSLPLIYGSSLDLPWISPKSSLLSSSFHLCSPCFLVTMLLPYLASSLSLIPCILLDFPLTHLCLVTLYYINPSTPPVFPKPFLLRLMLNPMSALTMLPLGQSSLESLVLCNSQDPPLAVLLVAPSPL